MHRQSWILPPAILFAAAAWSTDVNKCVEIESPAERLACYDAAHGRKRAEKTEAAPVATATPAAASSQPAATSDEFGLEQRLQREKKTASEEAKEITAAVVTADYDSRGFFTLTLDNGQRWRLKESTTHRTKFKAGDRITVRRGALGSYLLRNNEGGGAMRAARLE